MALINTTTTGVLGSTFYGDGSGNLTVQKDGVTVNTITSAPTFSYYQSSAQTLPSTTNTKLTFTSYDWDTTGGMFASSRFTPTVAGYYSVNGALTMASSFCGGEALIYKNGSNFKSGAGIASGAYSNRFAVAGLVYCNGSTDYIEIWGYITTGQALTAATAQTYFQAALVRSA